MTANYPTRSSVARLRHAAKKNVRRHGDHSKQLRERAQKEKKRSR